MTIETLTARPTIVQLVPFDLVLVKVSLCRPHAIQTEVLVATREDSRVIPPIASPDGDLVGSSATSLFVTSNRTQPREVRVFAVWLKFLVRVWLPRFGNRAATHSKTSIVIRCQAPHLQQTFLKVWNVGEEAQEPPWPRPARQHWVFRDRDPVHSG